MHRWFAISFVFALTAGDARACGSWLARTQAWVIRHSHRSHATVIGGSYRRHLAEIFRVRAFLRAKGVHVYLPEGNQPLNPGAEFVILDTDRSHDPYALQMNVFRKMDRSTIHVVVTPGGYLGLSSALEIGYAIAAGLPVYTTEAVADPKIEPFCRRLRELFPDFEPGGE